MCKKPKLKKGNTASRIDPCMVELVKNLDWIFDDWRVVACCCGHGKYPMSIVVKSPHDIILELCSDEYIPRAKRFYKRDEEGYYFIPETLKNSSLNKKQEN